MPIERTRAVLSQTDFSDEDIVYLLGLSDPEDCALLQKKAFDLTTELMGDYVYYRGLIEVSNICTASCRYCGIRRENHALKRYTMTKDEVVAQAVWAAKMGYGSVALQAGERRDPKWVDFIEACLRDIHAATVSDVLPEGVGITISLGEQSPETYERWAKAAGCPHALRYLARFETSNDRLFALLHGEKGDHEKQLSHRFKILEDQRRAGYQTGTGVMIGLPGQTLEDLCRDIRTFKALDVDMIGMGPYLVSEGGDMAELGQMAPEPLLQLSLNMIAVTRLVLRNVNIAATTALQVLRDDGRELGILYGANVVMPNLSPTVYREGYQLYSNKPGVHDTPESTALSFEKRIQSCGRRVGWNLPGSSRRWAARTSEKDVRTAE